MLKKGVRLERGKRGEWDQDLWMDYKDVLDPRMALAYPVIRDVYKDWGVQCVITSALEGKHKSGSRHYRGLALDFRVWGIMPEQFKEFAECVRRNLGDCYDVVDEWNAEGNPSHLHVEYDPKETD